MANQLLLATDLSARCDRAMDRAIQLARQWQAKLDVVSVVEGSVAPDQLLGRLVSAESAPEEEVMARALEREFADVDVIGRMHIARGEPTDAIARQAKHSNADLIVTGMARNETFGRFLLGTTVESLSRHASQPLLVVRKRVNGAYQRIVVSTDFSEASRQALVRTVELFPEQEINLYHVFSLPMAGLGGVEAEQKMAEQIQNEDAVEFLNNSGLTAEQRRWIRVVVEVGSLESQMARYVRSQDTQLVVMGSHGRTGLLNMLIGSAAARMLEWLPCDSLIVRQAKA